MFAEECRKVARDYPDVTFEEAMIDTISMKLVMAPQQYDVVVTTNQFGDILTDIGAGLVGGLGLAPGLCVGERQAMAQATHGSAPDIAGRNIANPYAMIMSGQMLLAWLGRKHNEPKATAAAGYMQTAIDKVIAEAKHLTGDLGGKASTQEMGDAIAAAVDVIAAIAGLESSPKKSDTPSHVQSSSQPRTVGNPRHGARLCHARDQAGRAQGGAAWSHLSTHC